MPSDNRALAGQRWRDNFAIIGHRGAAGLVAENTLPSFRAAANLAVDAVELDVYWHQGELLVIHDDRLERTTSGKGQLTDCSLPQLRALDAGDAAQIPLLAEVFAALPRQIAVNIELKGPGTAVPVARAMALWQPEHEILVSSFELDELREFVREDETTAVAPLFHRANKEMLAVGEELGACAINLNSRIATAARLGTIRDAGFGALVYTVNSVKVAKQLRKDGATGVFTDRPDRVTLAATN